MKGKNQKCFYFFLAATLWSFVFFPAMVSAAETDVQGEVNVTDRARAVLLVEGEHGSVILAKSPGLPLPIASLTKLMTALVFLELHPAWNEIVRIEEQDVDPEGRAVLHVGDRIRIRDLFRLALVRSDNTATRSLVASSGLSEEGFVSAMNSKAQALGLGETAFTEPTGLSPENRSTARDLVHLAAIAFRDPTIGGVLRQSSVTIRFIPAKRVKSLWVSKKIYSTNMILGKRVGNFQVLLGKTGTTDEAGYSFIVNAKTLTRPRRHLYAVILSAASAKERFDLALDLLSFGTMRLGTLESPAAPGLMVHSAMVR
jgi:D-alanyl-D-alanine carboxypeptidase/D-alanyl-D-alanine endopeptidase (penicillin-binding protein 7)